MRSVFQRTGGNGRGRHRLARALASGFAALAVVSPAAAGSATLRSTGSATGPQAAVSPNALLANQQVVTVSWSNFTPTSLVVNFQGARNDDVAILECVAKPPASPGSTTDVWYFFRDCYSAGENLGGNIVAPSLGINASEIPLAGATDVDGTGTYPFEVQAGTLHTQEVTFPCAPGTTTDCNNPYDIQCDDTHACVLKVIELPAGTPPIPNQVWQGPPTPTQDKACAKNRQNCNYTQLIDSAVSVPLNFGPIPNCPPLTQGNLTVEGAASASYALQSWAADVCQGSSPVTVSYSDVWEAKAKTDFLGGNTNIAVAAIAPTTAQVSAASAPPGYAAAPLDAAGVSVVFNMIDPATGLPIGCSENVPPSQCHTAVRLTPRLMAMLITNSATLNENQTNGHAPAYAPPGSPNFVEPLTADPEFRALNPGFRPPGFCSGPPTAPTCTALVQEPVLRVEQTDDTFILTQWIADDHDAQQFLAGRDACGAKLNADWQGVTYPNQQFQELASTSEGTEPDSDSYFPVQGTAAVLEALLYGIPVGGSASGNGAQKSWTPVSAANYAFFGVMDTVSAHRSGLPSAQLIAADPTGSELAKYVTVQGGGVCTPDSTVNPTGFVSDSDAGLAEAYKIMGAGPNGTMISPVSTTDPNAYPLAKIDYAFVPTTGISLATAKLVATLLDFAAGPGQTPTYLPPGYPPLPANLAAQARHVVEQVVTAATPPANHPTTTTTTPTTTVASTTTTTLAPPSASPGSSVPTAAAATPAGPAPTTTAVAATPAPPPAEAPPARARTSSPPPVQLRIREASVDVKAAGRLSGGWLLPLLGCLAILFAAAGLVLRRLATRAARA